MISADSTLFGHSLARRRTRRWLVVAFWGGLVPLLCVGFQELFFIARGSFALNTLNFALLFIFWITIFLGGVRAGGWVKPFRTQKKARNIVQPLFAKPKPTQSELIAQELAMDERESSQRDHIHYVAYSIARTLTVFIFAFYCLLGFWNQELLRQAGPLLFFLLTIALWSLPQTMILWTEPDMVPEAEAEIVKEKRT
ncbi:MAG: hypothetical protein ABSB30_09005 [Terracidiphilus sp.]|jgi:hypothetical protein